MKRKRAMKRKRMEIPPAVQMSIVIILATVAFFSFFNVLESPAGKFTRSGMVTDKTIDKYYTEKSGDNYVFVIEETYPPGLSFCPDDPVFNEVCEKPLISKKYTTLKFKPIRWEIWDDEKLWLWSDCVHDGDPHDYSTNLIRCDMSNGDYFENKEFDTVYGEPTLTEMHHHYDEYVLPETVDYYLGYEYEDISHIAENTIAAKVYIASTIPDINAKKAAQDYFAVVTMEKDYKTPSVPPGYEQTVEREYGVCGMEKEKSTKKTIIETIEIIYDNDCKVIDVIYTADYDLDGQDDKKSTKTYNYLNNYPITMTIQETGQVYNFKWDTTTDPGTGLPWNWGFLYGIVGPDGHYIEMPYDPFVHMPMDYSEFLDYGGA